MNEVKKKYIDVDSGLHCLMIQTAFSKYSYWNYIDSIKMAGFKAYAVPLGLITVAALLPKHWQFKLIDMNIDGNEKISEEDWAWADIVCLGGMITQQVQMLEVASMARERGKFVVIGGADPSSQPHVYEPVADALLLGEGELNISMWLESCRRGECQGTFKSEGRANMCEVPIPRYDLVHLMDYHLVGIQFARGCPHHCEFCSVIELFGRVPRRKRVAQFIEELECIYKAGFRGRVDVVDDNFIGNIKVVKDELLPAMIEWNTMRGAPFSFSAELSLNAAEQPRLLQQMHRAGFRDVFVGIETPDEDVLKFTNKKINTTRSILERVEEFYKHGLVVHAGFILGFDNEKKGMDKKFIPFIRDCGVVLAMMGLLVALPGTKLYKRLQAEGRLLDFSNDQDANVSSLEDSNLKLGNLESDLNVVDQTTGGLNFKTIRDRKEIYEEYKNIITNIYSPRAYMKRIVDAMLRLKKRRYIPNPANWKQDLWSLWVICYRMSLSDACFYFWYGIFKLLFKDPSKVPLALEYMCLYFHFKKQTKYVIRNINKMQAIEKK